MWNPRPVQQLVIVDPTPPLQGFGSGLTLMLHGKLEEIRVGRRWRNLTILRRAHIKPY